MRRAPGGRRPGSICCCRAGAGRIVLDGDGRSRVALRPCLSRARLPARAAGAGSVPWHRPRKCSSPSAAKSRSLLSRSARTPPVRWRCMDGRHHQTGSSLWHLGRADRAGTRCAVVRPGACRAADASPAGPGRRKWLVHGRRAYSRLVVSGLSLRSVTGSRALGNDMGPPRTRRSPGSGRSRWRGGSGAALGGAPLCQL